MILEIITVVIFFGIIIYLNCKGGEKKLSKDEEEYLRDFTW